MCCAHVQPPTDPTSFIRSGHRATLGELEDVMREWGVTLSARADRRGMIRAEVRRGERTHHGVARTLAKALVAAFEAAALGVDVVAA